MHSGFFHKIKITFFLLASLYVLSAPSRAEAATSIPFTVNMSEAVNVITTGGTPRIAVTVGNTTRYAAYSAGTGTSALTFTYDMVAGDVDLDGLTLTSPIDLNGGVITDLSGNPATLTFTAPDTSNVRVNYPSLGMDFVYDADGRYTLNGNVYDNLTSFLSAAGGTFSRSSIGTYYDSTGTLQTAPAGTPRFDYDPSTHIAKGILFEEQRTNYVKNSQFTGAGIGITPSHLSVNGGGAGVTASITAVGTINGENYIDVTFTGTSTAGGIIYPNVFFTPATSDLVPASSGQTWTGRVHIISDTGTSPNAMQIQIAELDSSNVYLNASNVTISAGNYQTLTRTLSSASTAYIRLIILTSLNNGQTINRTIRLSVPQLELGPFATSYIPTTGSIGTRASETMIIPIGSWYNQSAGTFYNDVSWQSRSSGSFWPMFFRVDDTTSNNRWNLFYTVSGATAGVDSWIGGASQAGWSASSSSTGAVKVAAAQALNNANSAFNGVLKTPDTTYTPPNVTRLFLDGSNANKWTKVIKYYPLRVPDTQLQLMTQ